ncbi:tetraspanin-8 [Anolis carolinensis]|uniref:tetraspanin-8 n=1 Tax=Anolis carolinensis TaxID=28377 RepID=UPI002F2B2BB9
MFELIRIFSLRTSTPTSYQGKGSGLELPQRVCCRKYLEGNSSKRFCFFLAVLAPGIKTEKMAGVSSCMKYSMFFFNFLFWVCGCIILGVSIWLRVSKSGQGETNIDTGSLLAGVNVLIAVGSIIMVLGFLGCCGAMKESQCMLLLFFIGLLAILLLQIVAGILGAVYKSQAKDTLKTSINSYTANLQGNSPADREFQETFRKFEKENKCCGLFEGKADWGTTKGGCEDGNETKFCGDVIIDFFENNMIIVMGIAFGLAFIEVLGMVFSMSLYCQIQRK